VGQQKNGHWIHKTLGGDYEVCPFIVSTCRKLYHSSIPRRDNHHSNISCYLIIIFQSREILTKTNQERSITNEKWYNEKTGGTDSFTRDQ